ncbi:MAG TPA: nuclear transport factor 2 family protein [Steroidobacteraceae bacterium]|nr:nuclear transport factor 2 family protein [Steroidobacteraceae bacterium]
MNTRTPPLLSLAQAYFDAAYEMDADQFASLFHRSSSVTKIGDHGEVSVTPIEKWLAGVRNAKAPKLSGMERHQLSDEILSMDVVRDLALLKLRFQIPPRHFTDMLSCLNVNGTWKIVQKVMTVETR